MELNLKKELAEFSSGNKVELLFAAEAGSRAWGFPSKDSDYDLRFIYSHPTTAYLSIQRYEDTLSYMDDNHILDISGWDIMKTLIHARTSNPSLIEWLKSPIVYADYHNFRAELLGYLNTNFSPRALAHHYFNMMTNVGGKKRTHFREFPTDVRTVKEFLYPLRCIMVLIRLEKEPKLLPAVPFVMNYDRASLSIELRARIDNLLEMKMNGHEKDPYKDPIIEEFLNVWFHKRKLYVEQFGNYEKGDPKPLDALLHRILREI